MVRTLSRWNLIGAFAACCTLPLMGCGPATSMQTIANATVALEAARGAQADSRAIYEMVSAEEHLRKAREEEGYSDFKAAIKLALRAKDLAEIAQRKAQSGQVPVSSGSTL